MRRIIYFIIFMILILYYGAFASAFSHSDNRLLAEVYNRVNQQKFYDTPEGHFRIHYDTIGADEVYQPHTDEDPQDGHPDFVNRCGDYFERCWSYFDSVGFSMPPYDGTNGGGNNLYDIYMTDYYGVYGITWAESLSTQYPNRPNSYTSYIFVNPRFSGSGYDDRTMPLRITAANQFFHAIEYGYNYGVDQWFRENCASWSEKILFGEVRDNYRFLPDFYNYPHYAHSTANGGHEFGMFVWCQYIYQNFGGDALLDIWGLIVDASADNALNLYFADFGTTMGAEYRRFIRWNYFTGSRDDGFHFDGGADYPEVHIMSTYDTLPIYNETSIEPPSGIGCNYIAFENLNSFDKPIKFLIDGDDDLQWAMDAIIFKYNGDVLYDSSFCNADGVGSLLVKQNGGIDSVILIITLLTAGARGDYTYSAYVDSLTAIDDNAEPKPSGFSLGGVYPNPFNSQAKILFTVNNKAAIRLIIYNLLGQQIHTTAKQYSSSGEYNITWNAEGQPSGIYLFDLTDGNTHLTRKISLVK